MAVPGRSRSCACGGCCLCQYPIDQLALLEVCSRQCRSQYGLSTGGAIFSLCDLGRGAPGWPAHFVSDAHLQLPPLLAVAPGHDADTYAGGFPGWETSQAGARYY